MATEEVKTPEQHAEAEIAKFTGYAAKDGEVISSSDPAANTTDDEKAQAATTAAAEKAAAKAKAGEEKPKTALELAKAAIVAARGTPAEGAEDEEQAEEPAESEQPTQPAQVAARPKETAQERINQAIAKQRAAERERDELKRQLAAGAPKPAAEQPAAATQPAAGEKALPAGLGAKPDPNAFEFKEFDGRYISALSAWETRKVILEAREEDKAERARENQGRQQIEAQREVQTRVQKMSDEALEKYPDFAQVVVEAGKQNAWPLSPQLGELLLNSDHGADIAYALATDVPEAARVFGLSLLEQAAWFGRMEASLAGSSTAQPSRKPTVKPSKAPQPPVHQARGAGGNPAPVRADTTDFSAFERMAQKKG